MSTTPTTSPFETDNSLPVQPKSANDGSAGDPNSIEAPPFDLAQPFDLKLPARGRRGNVMVRHMLRRPTLRDLMERDAAQPYRTRMIKEDKEEPIPDLNNKANIRLYNKLIAMTSGYKYNVQEDMSADDRAQALAAIPDQHKNDIIGVITPVETEYVPEALADGAEDSDVFVYGEGLTYKFKTTFGVQGKFEATFVMNEPNDAQLTEYRGSTHFAIDKAGGFRKPITEMTVDLKPAVKIFDELVQSVEGLVVDGTAVDVTNKLHLQLIDAYMKRSVLNQLVKQTQLDLDF